MGECKGAKRRNDGLQDAVGLSGWIGTVAAHGNDVGIFLVVWMMRRVPKRP